MINGLYNAAAGMNAELARQDVITNNLANVNTTGFKKDVAIFQAFPNMLVARINDRMGGQQHMAFNPNANPAVEPLGVVGHGAQLAEVDTDYSEGTLSRTDQTFDLALEGKALFTVQTEDGERAYTRAGNFTLDADGDLVTKNGEQVLSQRGAAIKIDPSAKEIVVDQYGHIKVDGVEADQLQLTKFDNINDLEKRGDNLYASKDGVGLGTATQDDAVRVHQGFLEGSNVQVTHEMVDMITVSRAYEANQKVAQIMDSSLNQAINQVGRV
jgi:flagellar basal-body rod protein FlgG